MTDLDGILRQSNREVRRMRRRRTLGRRVARLVLFAALLAGLAGAAHMVMSSYRPQKQPPVVTADLKVA